MEVFRKPMIRRDLVFIGVIIVLLTIIFYQSCSGPEPYDKEKETYLDSIKVLKSEKAFKAAQFDSISTMANTLVKEKDSLTVALVKEIHSKKVIASKAVEAIPVRVMEENPEISYALSAKDDVIEKQAVLIDTLKSQVEFECNVRENLVALHYDQAKIETQMSELKDMRIVKLEKDLRKERRSGKLARVLLPIVGVGMFLLGSQL